MWLEKIQDTNHVNISVVHDVPAIPMALFLDHFPKGNRKKNNGYFTVRLTVRVDPPSLDFFLSLQ